MEVTWPGLKRLRTSRWQTQGASDLQLHVEAAQAFSAASFKPKCVLYGLLPCSQQPVSGPYPESDESNPHLMVTGSIFTQVFQVVPFFSLPRVCSYSKWMQSVVQYCKKILTFKKDALIHLLPVERQLNRFLEVLTGSSRWIPKWKLWTISLLYTPQILLIPVIEVFCTGIARCLASL
jgi:hypothetical protein